ncbi:MAG: glutamyl-tRNA reductase [Brevinematia bacterium]
MYFVIGINHNTANVDVRDRYYATSNSLKMYYDKLSFIEEVVIISTCNRFEIYGHTSRYSKNEINNIILSSLNVLPSDRRFFYFITSEDAIRHIFNVASGLDSKIIGESQIYDQVKKSYYYALSIRKTRYFLNKLFQKALFVASKVRKKYSIGDGNVSLGSIIKNEISKVFRSPKILIVGTGEVVKSIIPHLKTISNNIRLISTKHLDRAISLSRTFNINFGKFRSLKKIIKDYNVIITATNCPFPIIDNKYLKKIKYNTLIFDLAIPRNVKIDFIPNNIKLYNIDDICEISNENISDRKSFVLPAKELINHEVMNFMDSIKCDLSKRKILIGSRKSKLAQKQVEEFFSMISKKIPSLKVRFEVKYFDTTGDLDKETPIYKIEGSDFFTDIIEEKLEKGEIDIAIHSAKDLPDIHKDNLITISITESIDKTDCLVLRRDLKNYSINTIPSNSIIGVSSRRRIEQLKKIRPDLLTKDIRGNIEERLSKLDNGEYDGIIMATIALKRLGLEDRISEVLPTTIFDTNPLQGSLAIQIRKEDIKKFLFLLKLDSRTKIVFDTIDNELEEELINLVNKYYWQKFVAFKKTVLKNPDKIIKANDNSILNNINKILESEGNYESPLIKTSKNY